MGQASSSSVDPVAAAGTLGLRVVEVDPERESVLASLRGMINKAANGSGT